MADVKGGEVPSLGTDFRAVSKPQPGVCSFCLREGGLDEKENGWCLVSRRQHQGSTAPRHHGTKDDGSRFVRPEYAMLDKIPWQTGSGCRLDAR